MNCPGHIAVYQSNQHSYRDLPIRMAEFGTCYRYERSGVLHGMLRVRGFTQDDAHVFCTPEQVPDEIDRLLDLVDEMLTTFGYPYDIELSTKPEKALGSDQDWDGAVKLLAERLEARGVPFEIDEGGGAFYGPKLDFKLIDAIGRKWQGPTVQLDFNLPDRFEMEYVGEDNQPHRPVMLHRVLVGSMERFVGGLIEHYAGAFPTWLAPEQVRVLPISEQWVESAGELAAELEKAGVRVHVEARETLGYRIREAETMKIPFMAVVGEREAADGTVAVRKRGAGKKQEVMPRARVRGAGGGAHPHARGAGLTPAGISARVAGLEQPGAPLQRVQDDVGEGARREVEHPGPRLRPPLAERPHAHEGDGGGRRDEAVERLVVPPQDEAEAERVRPRPPRAEAAG